MYSSIFSETELRTWLAAAKFWFQRFEFAFVYQSEVKSLLSLSADMVCQKQVTAWKSRDLEKFVVTKLFHKIHRPAQNLNSC